MARRSHSASTRLEYARQQMEAALQRHDQEFLRAVKLKDTEDQRKQFVETQLEKFEMVSALKTADRAAVRRAAEAQAREAAAERAAQRAAQEGDRRRIRERHEEIVAQRRDELLEREFREEERLRQRQEEKEQERLRRRIAARERAEYIQQVNRRNQALIQDKADRTHCDIAMRQHDKLKERHLGEVRDRMRQANDLKAARHQWARQQQERETEALRLRQCAQDWEQALVDEEIERMRRIVKEDRRNLDRALEQLRKEG